MRKNFPQPAADYDHCLTIRRILKDYLGWAPDITYAADYELRALQLAESLNNDELYEDLVREMTDYRACKR